jgi:hypothetical protein
MVALMAYPMAARSAGTWVDVTVLRRGSSTVFRRVETKVELMERSRVVKMAACSADQLVSMTAALSAYWARQKGSQTAARTVALMADTMVDRWVVWKVELTAAKKAAWTAARWVEKMADQWAVRMAYQWGEMMVDQKVAWMAEC